MDNLLNKNKFYSDFNISCKGFFLFWKFEKPYINCTSAFDMVPMDSSQMSIILWIVSIHLELFFQIVNRSVVWCLSNSFGKHNFMSKRYLGKVLYFRIHILAKTTNTKLIPSFVLRTPLRNLRKVYVGILNTYQYVTKSEK